MDAFLTFFEEMPNWQKLAWVFTCISANWIIEAGFPLFKTGYSKWRHARTNLILLTCSLIINAAFAYSTVWIFDWMKINNFGLLNWIDLPTIAELFIAIAILDFVAQYFVHYLLHKVRWMWRFHIVHHSDTMVDATTGTRHHPGDYAMREVFALGAIVISGIPLAYYFFYRIITVFFAYFTHANINMPVKVDKAMSYVFVTPNMHKFHHHFELPWTDTNFGNIFSCWDRIFGTFTYGDPKDVKYGLDITDSSKDIDLLYQLNAPFDKSIKTKT